MLSHMLRAVQKTTTAITFVNSSFTQRGTAGSDLVINNPSSTQEGDLMICLIVVAGGLTWTVPSGWTETLDASGRLVAYKVATNSEPSNYTFTASASTQIPAGYILTYRNAAWDTVGTISGLAQNAVAPSITVSENNSLVLCFVSAAGVVSLYTTPSGWDLVTNDTTVTPTSAVFSKGFNSGSTGTITVNGSASGTTSRALLLSIKPV